MELGFDYTLESFKQIVFNPDQKVAYDPAETWSNDLWFLDQANRNLITNEGPLIVNSGKAKGTLIGGNLCTIALLTGTPYLRIPDEDIILFIEDDYETNFNAFDRILFNVIEAIGRNKIKGVLLGRFEQSSNLSDENIKDLFKHRYYFSDIPIIANLDFGHTTPIISIPYGGVGEIKADDKFEFTYSTTNY